MSRAAVALLGLLACCSGEVRPEIVAGVDACRECGMRIDRPEQACGFVDGGEFVTFDSPLCLLRNYEARSKRKDTLPVVVYFADQRDALLHTAETTTFVLSAHLPTVMQSGVACFGHREDAEAALLHDDERLTDWEGFRLALGTPDRVIDLQFDAASGQSPEVIEVLKGERMLWRAMANGFDRELLISIKGYPEAGVMRLPADGSIVEFRMRASRPGTGFPIIEAGSERTFGMLRVAGSHTADEEAS